MMRNKHHTSPISIQPTTVQSMKPGVRRSKRSTNPNRRKMTVSVSDSFEELHELNQRALKVLAKRA
jgi:hypothetical protein